MWKETQGFEEKTRNFGNSEILHKKKVFYLFTSF